MNSVRHRSDEGFLCVCTHAEEISGKRVEVRREKVSDIVICWGKTSVFTGANGLRRRYTITVLRCLIMVWDVLYVQIVQSLQPVLRVEYKTPRITLNLNLPFPFVYKMWKNFNICLILESVVFSLCLSRSQNISSEIQKTRKTTKKLLNFCLKKKNNELATQIISPKNNDIKNKVEITS